MRMLFRGARVFFLYDAKAPPPVPAWRRAGIVERPDFDRTGGDPVSLRIPKKNIRSFVVLLTLGAMLLFILLANNTSNYVCTTLQAVTEWTDDAGTYPLPHEYAKTAGASYRMSAVLPSFTEYDCLIFRTENLPVEVTLEGTLLYRTDMPAAHQTLGDEWHMITLPYDAAGKTITIRSTVLFADGSNFISAVYVGNQANFVRQIVRRHLLEYLISVLLLLQGVAMLLASKLLLSPRLAAHMPASFAMLSIVLGLWSSTQTAIPEILWGNTGVLLFCTYGLLPLATVSTCFFLRTLPAPGRLKTVYLWLGLFQLAYWAFTMAGELFRFAAFMETLPYTRMAMMALLVLFLFQLPGLIKNRQENYYMLVGLSCLAVMIVVDLANLHAGVYDYSHNTRFGILLMTMLIAFQFMLRIRKGIRIADEADLMRRLAYRDPLTRLGNRLALVRDQEILIARKSGCVGIVQMDINNLKPVNDQFGHEEGDALIRRAAGAISAAFDDIGISYRIGGDEFVSLLTEGACEITAEECLTRLETACETQNRGQAHPLSIALGFAVFNSATGERFYDLVRAADMRMYQKKREMKGEPAGAAPTPAPEEAR